MELPIDEILDGYTINAPDRSVRKQARKVIHDVTGVKVELESISYQKGKIRIDASPLLRSQIHIHKNKIIKQLSNKLDKRQIKDLR